ncbi:hypothetical protein ABW21_db0202547 [Orbilia brochopaga]|nr:hypothetical protein ABW21_db0202547 [Drechslerella brochopaga]
MSRRIQSLQVRAASSSRTPRLSYSYNFTFTNMDDDYSHHMHAPAQARASNSINPPTVNPASSTISTPPSRMANTPTSSRVWDPSRGIVFAPSPTSPWTPPLSRGFTTSNSPSFPEPSSRITPRSRRAKNWAALMNLTADGQEISNTARTKKTPSKPKKQKSQEPFTLPPDWSPLNETTALYNALEDEFETIPASETEVEEHDGPSAAALADIMQGEATEDPAADIERVKTPEGEKLLWRKKPVVYTDETDEHVPLAFQVAEETVEEGAEVTSKLFGVGNYVNAEGKSPEIYYVTDVDTMETVIKLFENEKVLGFDMEWHPWKVLRPPENDKDIRLACSVLQVASADKVAIFQLAKYPATTKTWLSPTFKKILENPDILKTGVSVRFDLQRLATVINVSPAGALELGELHTWLLAAQDIELKAGEKPPQSLASLCQHHLGFPLYKGDVRTSNWSLALNADQKKYAADDAYASYRIFDEMDRIRRSLDPRPALPPTYSMVHEEVVDAYHKKVAKSIAEANEKASKKTLIRVPKNLNPALEEAYEWVKTYAKTVPGEILKAKVPDLRCYTMWHNQSLDVEEVASECRSPPLTEAYVCSKILEAIHLETLPYNCRRLAYVFKVAPTQGIGRYYMLRKEMFKTLNELREHPERADELIPKPPPRIKIKSTTPETEQADSPTLKIRHIANDIDPDKSKPKPMVKADLESGTRELDDEEPLARVNARRKHMGMKPVDGLNNEPVNDDFIVTAAVQRNIHTNSLFTRPERNPRHDRAGEPSIESNVDNRAPKIRRTTPASPWLMKTIKFGVSGELEEAVGGLTGDTSVRLTESTEVDDEDLLVPPPARRERKVFVPRRRKVDGDSGS